MCITTTLYLTPQPPHCWNPTCRLCECTEAEAEIILQLKNELREKELKLTDIRLEALSSAHHLDQIREAMNRMQVRLNTLRHALISNINEGQSAAAQPSPPRKSILF